MVRITRNTIEHAVAELRSWGAVAIVGAGASLDAGMPLAAQLRTLLWSALDADPSARDTLAGELGQEPMAAKDLIGEDPDNALSGLKVVESSKRARSAYQYGFSALDAERSRQPSVAHQALARLLHHRVVELVISLNWDTQLEAAYQARYGSLLTLDSGWLYKPHGDAARPDLDWVLPHQPGFVPSDLLSHINRLASERPRTLLVVGYSERDEEVVNTLTGPLSHRWQVVRISPNASGELDIPLPASKALSRLTDALCPTSEVPGWEYVSFADQHDLGPALDGCRLGPKDVRACPKLPEVEALKRHIDVARSAILIGESGSGKSVTAYQAAYDLHLAGWEVLRLEEPVTYSVQGLVNAVQALPRRSVLVVDDAQAVDPRLSRILLETSSATRAILLVSSNKTDVLSNSVALDETTAVATLAKVCHERSSELFPLLKRLDPTVGEGFFDEPLDKRISEAAKSGIAWQFFFVLTGGEKRVREMFAALRDADRADLLLGVIAACQFLSRDGGVSPKRLGRIAASLDKNAAWVTRTLRVLKKQRTVIGEATLRCTHMKLADVVLRIICQDRNDPEWAHFIGTLRNLLASEETELAGIPWLLHALRFNGAFDFDYADTVVDQDTWERIIRRCWQVSDSAERSGALSTLDTLDYWHDEHHNAIKEHSALLGRWLEETDDITAFAMGWLLNNVSHKSPDIAKSICLFTDPSALANFFNRMNWKNAAGRAWLLQRLAVCAPVSWYVQLQSALDLDAIKRLMSDLTDADVYAFSEIQQAIPYSRADFKLTLFEVALPILVSAFKRDPVESFLEADEMLWQVLGFYPHLFRRSPPTPRQRELASRFATALDTESLAATLSTSRQRDWDTWATFLFFLREADLSAADRVASLVDFSRLDRTSEGLWGNPPHELLSLLVALATRPDMQPSEAWVSRHTKEVSKLSTVLAAVAPQVVADKLRAGSSLIIDAHGWQHAAYGLARLALVDTEIAMAVAEASKGQIAHDLECLERYLCEDVPDLVMVLQNVAPSVLDEIFATIDVSNAEKHWDTLLRGIRQEQKAVVALLNATTSLPDPMAELISQLRMRYPRATAPVGSRQADAS